MGHLRCPFGPQKQFAAREMKKVWAKVSARGESARGSMSSAAQFITAHIQQPQPEQEHNREIHLLEMISRDSLCPNKI
jgi:hypothetical protein